MKKKTIILGVVAAIYTLLNDDEQLERAAEFSGTHIVLLGCHFSFSHEIRYEQKMACDVQARRHRSRQRWPA